MKVVFFSPFARVSAIGRVTALLVDALERQGHTSVVVRTERESLLDLPPHSVTVPVLAWIDEEQVRAVAQNADAIVYQMGNNYGFHRGGVHWMPLLPGILCLHDFVLAHLFAEWAEHHGEQAEFVLEDWYGATGVKDFFEACASTPQRFSDVASRNYPLTEWICTKALAVVAHSHWGMDRVQSACAGPLRVLPLPYDAPGANGLAQDAGTSLADDKVRILTVGHVNSNKRIDSVIRAIGASPILRARVSYRLCGLVQARTAEELADLAQGLGVDLIVSGECDDASLQRAMIEADIACCLRWPSFESASATAIEALLYGKAVVVTDTAFYGELPDHVVRKIPADLEEVPVLTRVLEEWVQDPQARRRLATTAQHWARERFNPDHYVRQLIALAPEVAAARPVMEMARQLGTMVEGWNGAPALLASEQLIEPLRIFQTALPAAPAKPS